MAHDTNTSETFYNMLSCDHLDELEVPANDLSIWRHAKEHDLIIVTNDEDYVDLINLRRFPPKVVLLKTGIKVVCLFQIF